MAEREKKNLKLLGLGVWRSLLFVTVLLLVFSSAISVEEKPHFKNAYAAMMYMGTPRDYEFYVALRVMLRSLAKLKVEADLVVIASLDVPRKWIQALKEEDGAKVVIVNNMRNPYQEQAHFDNRFKLTLNKLYAWTLINYDRVVMLDSDNLFLQNTDELFQCGKFCAVFINPCIFHTGLFVLQPSMEVFNDMLHEVEIKRDNPDGADQGFLGSYFSDLLDSPMFHPFPNGTQLADKYRLPLGYQMDASYYYLKLRWSIPCGPNSVITFPSALWLKPWYWWSWPVLPLGISWHEQRRMTLGYGAEIPVLLIQSIMYVVIMAMTRLARTSLNKLCNRRPEKSMSCSNAVCKIAAVWSILAAYSIPFFLIPRTIHPLLGWSIYLLGSLALLSVVVNTFLLPSLLVLMPWMGIVGALAVMAFPWYSDGIVRALAVFVYAFCCAPFVWLSMQKILAVLHVSTEREALFSKIGEPIQQPAFSKVY